MLSKPFEGRRVICYAVCSPFQETAMTNPPLSNIPGAAVMSDTLDFVKTLWGSMGVPGLTAPTLSVDELDKKINDLKAVEAWLSLNMNMLRGSIQALEVQRGTIATLKSVGASMAAAVKTGAADSKSLFEAHPYASAFFQHAAPPVATGWPAKDNTLTPPAPAPAPAPAAAPAAPAAAAPAAPASGKTPDPAAQMANPALWWNLLQDQFKQAVSSAMTSEAVTGAAARASDAAAKFAAAATAATAGAPKAAGAATAKPASADGNEKGNGAAKKPAPPAAKRAATKPKE
jgi:hypothetical protein